jgi:hypothetical protein
VRQTAGSVIARKLGCVAATGNGGASLKHHACDEQADQQGAMHQEDHRSKGAMDDVGHSWRARRHVECGRLLPQGTLGGLTIEATELSLERQKIPVESPKDGDRKHADEREGAVVFLDR